MQIYKNSLLREFSKLQEPLFIEKPGVKKFNSLETRISSLVSASIAIIVFPLEELYHIANITKKISVFPLHLLSCIQEYFKVQTAEEKAVCKEKFINKCMKILDSAGHIVLIPFIRLIFVIRLLAAAIIHPRIAF